MLKQNKFATAVIMCAKENIINDKPPLYNPILLEGLDRKRRYRLFWSIFNKDFNKNHKDKFKYILADKIDIDSIQNKKIVIIENIEKLISDVSLQQKIHEIINICLKQNIQLVLCSDANINDLELNESLKSKMMYGLTVYLEEGE